MASPKNSGDALFEAIQDAVNKQDFSALQSSIERSVAEAADAIGDITRQVQDQAHRTQQRLASQAREKQLAEQTRLIMKERYGNPGGHTAAGVAMIVAGTGALGFFGLSLLGTAVIFEAPVLLGALAALCAASIALIAFGIGKISFSNSFKTYRDIIATRTYCYLDEIAQRTSSSPASVRKKVKRMIGCGLLRQAALDDGETFLIMSSQAYGEYQAARAEATAREHDRQAARERAQRIEQSLEPSTRDILARGEQFVVQIRASNEQIDDALVTEKLDRIERVVRNILEHAAEHPDSAPQLDRMMDYYLPTTVKLLDAYRKLDDAAVETASVANSKREITATLDMLCEAFEKLLDSLFRDVTWDVSTDISVLKTVLAQDGLTKSAFGDDASPNAR